MKLRTGILTALGTATGYFAIDLLLRRSHLELRGKVVLITGGSRGLGLAMAREFGAHGCIVAICARDKDELDRAQADLSCRGVRSHTFVCDITDRDQVLSMMAQVLQFVGRVDILVNNAGIIKVGPLAEMEIGDFHEAMNVMFWGTLHTTLAVLPAMRDRKQGSIVNITSIGGKVSVPHLLPYCCAKFAAVALSEGLRAELQPDGVRVTTIAPGLLRTGSHLNAEFTGKQAEEYGWFAAGAASPLVSIGAERAARAVVQATIRGDSEKILSVPADVAARFHGLLPGLTTELLSVVNRMLPRETGGFSAARAGRDMEDGFNSRLWKIFTTLGQRAAESLHEIPTRKVVHHESDLLARQA